MINAGIWLDKRKAVIVYLTSTNVEVKTVHSEIEEYRAKGGSRSKTAYGPVITVKEKSYTEREKHQFEKFFQLIVDEIKNVSNLYLMGPSQSKDKLNDYIKNHKIFSPTIIQIDSADSMTDKQIIASVKDAFKHLNDSR
jgi:stalled ribosome rescue protein Dom34